MPGILWGDDYDRLKSSVLRVVGRFARDEPVRFIEIGTSDGKTGFDLMRVIEAHCEASGIAPIYTYIGIDPIVEIPYSFERPRYFHFRAASCDIIDGMPRGIHWCWIDGCHCAHCVGRDIALYGKLIETGGELCFHDASPRTQGLDPQDYGGMDGYHDATEAAKGIAVRKAIDSFMPGNSDFVLVHAAPDVDRGGVEIYRKVAS